MRSSTQISKTLEMRQKRAFYLKPKRGSLPGCPIMKTHDTGDRKKQTRAQETVIRRVSTTGSLVSVWASIQLHPNHLGASENVWVLGSTLETQAQGV